jgi:hypothetical protein
LLAASGCKSSSDAPAPRRDAGVEIVSHLRASDPSRGSAERVARSAVPRLEDIPALEREPASASCVNGWLTPARDTPLRKAPLDLIRDRPEDQFMVEEMRYFWGPEDPDVVSPESVVERWYVKAYVYKRPRQRGRWLLRRNGSALSVDARADHDSRGFGPGVWTRPGVRQKWADPFKFPCGSAAPGEPCVGLPREVLGCVAGS